MKISIYQRLVAWFLFVLSSSLILIFIVVLKEMIDVIDEGLMKTYQFESEPQEGYEYWENKAFREALPSWILPGMCWMLMVALLTWTAWKFANRAITGTADRTILLIAYDLLKTIPIRIHFDGHK